MKIRVMPDFECTGLWNLGDRGIMFEFEDLKLPELLKIKIMNWLEFYDSNYDIENSVLDQADKINLMGLNIAKEIKALFPDAYVEYLGEESKKVLDPLVSFFLFSLSTKILVYIQFSPLACTRARTNPWTVQACFSKWIASLMPLRPRKLA